MELFNFAIIVVFFILIIKTIRFIFGNNKSYLEKVGEEFENLVYRILDKNNTEDSFIAQNVYLKNPYSDNLNEIDIFLITPQAIFLIECKSWKGVLSYSKEKKDYWQLTKLKGRNTTKEQMYSPIKQNEIKIKAVKELFGLKYKPVYSFVVLDDRVLEKIYITSKKLVTQKEIVSVIRGITNNKKIYYSENDMLAIVDKLESFNENLTNKDKTNHKNVVKSYK